MADHTVPRWLLAAVGIAAFVTLAGPVWIAVMTGPSAGGGMHGGHMMGTHMGSGSAGVWSGPAMFVWTVSALVLVGGGSAIALSYAGEDSKRSIDTQREESDPIATLRERYVRGDLSEPEFEQRLEHLLASPSDETDSEHIRDRETEVRQ